MRRELTLAIGAVCLVSGVVACRPVAKDEAEVPQSGDQAGALAPAATAAGPTGNARAGAVDNGAGVAVARGDATVTANDAPVVAKRPLAAPPRTAPKPGQWAKLARTQMARPTDFAKLTAELKRKQALATGLDEAAVRVELERRALAGDADAALTLGLMLRYGMTATDKAQGERLIAAAAESGNPRAMAELGRLLLADETQADSAQQAEAWLRKAWAAGEGEGAYLLASAQRLGLLDAAAGEDSTALLVAAAEGGNDASRHLLTLLRNEIDGLAPAQLERWMTECAEAGDVEAMLQLATLKREASQSAAVITWLERAAASGSTDAIMMLALLVGRGETGAEARASAITHLQTQLAAPATASPGAKFALAKLLVLETDRTEARRAEALKLLREAGKDRIYQAAIAAMMIDHGVDSREALGTVLKLDDAAAYVRYVEMHRAQGDTEFSGLADASPKPLATVRPVYPIELEAAGTTGDVTVRFLVHADGRVDSCEVLSSDHPALSAAAVEAVQQWRFQPGTKEGKPVAAQMQITLPFRLSK